MFLISFLTVNICFFFVIHYLFCDRKFVTFSFIEIGKLWFGFPGSGFRKKYSGSDSK